MPLTRIEREILLNGGMDVKQSTELAVETTLRAVTNLRWDAQGELRKRPAYASSATPVAPAGADYTDATPEALFTRGSEVFALTKDCGVAVVDPTAPNTALMPVTEQSFGVTETMLKYAPRACRVSRRLAERTQYSSANSYIKQVVSAVYGDHLVIAWLDQAAGSGTSYLRAKAIHKDTGVVLATARQGATGLQASLAAIPYLVAGSEGVLITLAHATAAPFSIIPILYNAALRTFTAGTALSTNAKFATHTLANAYTGDSKFYLAFCDNTSGFMVAQYRTTSAVTTTHTGSAANPQFFSFAVHSAAVLITSVTPATAAYAEVFGTPANRVTVFATSSEAFYGVTCSLESATARSAVVYVNRLGTTTVPRTFGVKTKTVTFPSTTPVLGLTGLAPNTWLANAAFGLDGRSHVSLVLNPFATGAYGAGSVNTTVLLCRYYENTTDSVSRVEPVARLGHDRYFSLDSGIGGGHMSTTVDDRKVHIAFSADASADHVAFGFVGPQSIFHSTVEFPDDALPLPSVERAGKVVIASGVTLEWDGDLVYEAAPIDRPRIEVVAYTVLGTGDSFAKSGTAITLTDASAKFPANAVGRPITITGATTPGNNGTFTVTARTSDTVITYTNAAGATEAYAGTWVFGDVPGGVEGTYSIKAYVRAVDAAGELHRSAPSDAVSVTTTNQSEIRVYVTKPLHTAFDGYTARRAEAEVYITENGGSSYYLAADHDAAGDAEPKNYPGADTTSYHWVFDRVGGVVGGDTSDSQLYTDGGEVEPEPPPAFLSICRIGDLLWALDAEDRSRVWVSKPLVAGFAPEWSTTRTLVVGDEGTAIAESGGAATVFSANGAWAVYGNGPDANGNGQGFPPALKLPLEVSCIDPLVCKTSAGIVFRSRRGFCLLGQGLQQLGLPIDPDTKAPSLADYTYARIAFDEVHNEVRVVDAYLGRYWVYNLLEQKWSEWTQSASAQNAADVVVCDGRVWHLHVGGSSSSIRREYGMDETADATLSTEEWSIELPKVRVDSILGRGRIRELILALKVRATSLSDTVSRVNALTVTFETFGAGADAVEMFEWTGEQIADVGDGNGQVVALKMRPRNQQCSAFRVTVAEACNDTYSGSSPVSLRLVMAIDGKAMRHTRSSALKGPN